MIFINLLKERPTMKPQEFRIEDEPGAKRRPDPEPYVCIAEDEAPQVFDWLNGVSDADPEIGEIHLRLCFHCQEAVATMMTLDKEFKGRVRRCLHPANIRARRSMTVEPVDAHPKTANASSDRAAANDKPQTMKVGGGG
jgi:hypothetical protein